MKNIIWILFLAVAFLAVAMSITAATCQPPPAPAPTDITQQAPGAIKTAVQSGWDSSGNLLFKDSSGNTIFSVDGTNRALVMASAAILNTTLFTSNTWVAGTINGSAITYPTVTGGTYTTGTYTTPTVNYPVETGGSHATGTYQSPAITAPTISYPTVTQGTIAAAAISGCTMTGTMSWTGGTGTNNNLIGPYLTNPVVTGGAISGSTSWTATGPVTLSYPSITQATVTNPAIAGGTVTGTTTWNTSGTLATSATASFTTNMLVGTTTYAHGGTGVIAIGNYNFLTSPTLTANTVILYASGGKLYAMDSSGTATALTP